MSVSKPDDLAIAEIMKISHELTGVQLTDRHRSMVASRLQKRVSELGLQSISQYLEYYKNHRAIEQTRLIGMITTHHTFFFREFSHFEYLASTSLPALAIEAKARGDKKIKVWAAACSRGQEVYSLAMFLDFHLKRIDPTIGFEILGSDIDRESVAIAENGVYLRQELKEAPLALLADHWVKGTGEIEAYAKVRGALRKHCRFETKNLLELKVEPSAPKFDIIFCRNVFIYFNSAQIAAISTILMSRLDPKGYFFVGISESLQGLKLPLETQGPSVYRLPQKVVVPLVKNDKVAKVELVAAPVKPKLIRVLCVDDSSSILTLLKQILSVANGFEIVGTAINGIDAAAKVAALKPDVITLDIHMPEQNGLEYLEKNYRTGHPPVMMITSVSREDATLAGKALSLGASDYVEKPALSNLVERGEEIRAKLKCLAASVAGVAVKSGFDKSFQSKRTILNADDKLMVLALSLSHREKLKQVLREFPDPKVPCILLVEGASAVLGEIAKLISRETGRNVIHSDVMPQDFKANDIFIFDLTANAKVLAERFCRKKDISIMVFGELSRGGCDQILQFSGANLILEDIGGGVGTSGLRGAANEVVLCTSFAYLSQEFFYLAESKKGKAA